MPLTLKSIIQQAMLAAAPALIVGCGPADVHEQRVVPWTGAAPSSLDLQTCAGFCTPGPLGFCDHPDFKGCTPVALTADGGLEIDCNDGPPRDDSLPTCTGRRPAGLVEVRASTHGLAAFLAQSAHLEAASVVAFNRLARELKAHRAPAKLVDAAQRSARDEVRHARAMSRLASRFGARVPRVEARANELRPLDEVAVENEVEGCVRETFGAVVGAWQARTAGDSQIARAMAGIADDEARHAQLAWDVRAWALPKLTRAARGRIAGARAAAIEELRAPASVNVELVSLAGLPDAATSLRLHRALESSLWNARA